MTGAASFPSFIARRLALLLVTLLLVPSLSFVMFTLIQGDHTAPLDVLEELGSYLAAVFLQGELGSESFGGETFIRTRSALETVMDGFLVDCYLLVSAIVLAVLIGLTAGAFQATHPRTLATRAIGVVTALALSSPVYWLGLVALLLFAPGVGSIAEVPFLSTVDGYRDPFDDPLGFVHGLWLPALIVGTPLAAACARMGESQLAATLNEDFVRTARGKGVGRRRVVWRHALPAAAGPVVALVGVNMTHPHEPRADRDRLQHPRRLPLHRARAGQPRRRPRAGARRRGDAVHRARELPRRRDPRLAGPADPHGRPALTARIRVTVRSCVPCTEPERRAPSRRSRPHWPPRYPPRPPASSPRL